MIELLTGAEIKRNVMLGHIVIDPYNDDNIQPNSYDISLGRYYYEVTAKSLKGKWSQKDAGPSGMVHIPPNSVILTHTEEVFGTNDIFVAQIATKSTIARYGLDICGSAGFGDVGFVNKWTLEISNKNDFKVSLPVGRAIGQVYFTKLEGFQGDKYRGVYNSKPGDIWKPEDMLPKRL